MKKMYGLTEWLIYLKAYRLKHPELTLQQAQKLASVDYKRAMDPILGATTVSSVTGYGQKHSRPTKVGDMEPDELLDFKDTIDVPLNNAHIPNDIRNIISEYDVRDPKSSISDLIEERHAVSNRIDHLRTPKGRKEFINKWFDNSLNLMNPDLERAFYRDYNNIIQVLQTDLINRQNQIEEIGQHFELEIK